MGQARVLIVFTIFLIPSGVHRTQQILAAFCLSCVHAFVLKVCQPFLPTLTLRNVFVIVPLIGETNNIIATRVLTTAYLELCAECSTYIP